MVNSQGLHHDRVFLRQKVGVTERNLCLPKIVELAQWLAELEDRIILLSSELERLRLSVLRLGSELGL